MSLVPIYGDLLSGILQLYQVFLSFLFGIDYAILGWMVSFESIWPIECLTDDNSSQFLTVLIDIVVGIVPVLGDYLDYLFKANLRNLETLEVSFVATDRIA